MFGLRLTTKREILLWQALFEELREECARLRDAAELERQRANAAVNALLARTAKIALVDPRLKNDPAAGEDVDTAMRELFGTDVVDTVDSTVIHQTQGR